MAHDDSFQSRGTQRNAAKYDMSMPEAQQLQSRARR